MIPKSVVGVLSEDSKNVVKLIESAYNVSCQFATDKYCYLPLCACVTFLSHQYIFSSRFCAISFYLTTLSNL